MSLIVRKFWEACQSKIRRIDKIHRLKKLVWSCSDKFQELLSCPFDVSCNFSTNQPGGERAITSFLTEKSHVVVRENVNREKLGNCLLPFFLPFQRNESEVNRNYLFLPPLVENKRQKWYHHTRREKREYFTRNLLKVT